MIINEQITDFQKRKLSSFDIASDLYLSYSTRFMDNSPDDYLQKALQKNSFCTPKGLTASDILGKIEKISSCCDILELKKNPSTNNFKVHNASYCQQHLICPQCAKRAQNVRRSKYFDDIVEASKKYPYVYHLVFTIKDRDNLAEAIDHLKESLKNFRLMGQKRKDGKRSRGEFGKVKAGLMSTEIKRGDGSKKWHVHAHALVFCSVPLDYSIYDQVEKNKLLDIYGKDLKKNQLETIAKKFILFGNKKVPVSNISFQWYLATGGDSIDLDVIPVKGKGADLNMKMKEVLKYITTLTENLSRDDLFDILIDTYGRRMFASYGEFRGVSDDEIYEADTLEKEYSEFYSMSWNRSNFQYHNLSKSDGRTLEARTCSNEVKKEFLTRSAKLQGEYRTQRSGYRKLFGNNAPALDKIKSDFRARVKTLWHEYHNITERVKFWRDQITNIVPLSSLDYNNTPNFSLS